jgi:hypothetical protein
MDAPGAAPDHQVTSHSSRPADRKWSPVAFALDRLFPKRGRAPYTATERLVVLVIVRAMSFDASAEAFNCFLSYPTIARWAGVSLASVKRALQKHIDGPAPLLVRSKPGQTRGYRHACYRFTLVRAPEQLAAARDTARAERLGDVKRALRDLQPERIALQRQRRDFGGRLTDAEYARRLAELEHAVQRKIPARAQLRRRER